MTARPGENSRSPLRAWVRALERTAPIEQAPTRTLPIVIDSLAERFADVAALSCRRSTLSYRELAESSHRYARWAQAQGLARGEVVCLLMLNCPEYLAIWLGLTRIGVIVALLNTNLRGASLAHSINIVAPARVIVAGVLSDALVEIRANVSSAVSFWVHGSGATDLPRIDAAVAELRADPIAVDEARTPCLEDRALYIYTSGTTGLPKAANVSHLRLMQWSHWFAGMMDTTPSDRMYDCLPLYHSVGGVVATGATLVSGGTVVLRERFSAGEFWSDIVAERCTLFQYIGELCRYLLAGAPGPDERRHLLRLCCGNGLREDVWEAFQSRFRIPQILEYYAATEGSFSLYNCEGRRGAIGRIPPFLRHRTPVVLVRHDPASEAPLRDDAGHCARCAPGEVGEAIGEIADPSGRLGSGFEGYADEASSRQKILRDVFAPGDAWYRTGDLMRQDADGFFYFVDRVGDTFRWKGENVSTSEVAAVIGSCRGVRDAAVYGVTVPGADGRAGMAALVVESDFALSALRSELASRLPEYARPLFLRLVPTLEVTGTFKLNKQALSAQGFDPARTTDALYFDDRTRGAYVSLDGELHERLCAGRTRV
jgi:fatty-acyl-CoA synthase